MWRSRQQLRKTADGEAYACGDSVLQLSLEEIPQRVQCQVSVSCQKSLNNQGHIYVGQIYHVPVEFLLKC